MLDIVRQEVIMISFRVSKELKDKLTELANKDNRSLSDYIRLILLAFIKKLEG